MLKAIEANSDISKEENKKNEVALVNEISLVVEMLPLPYHG